MNKKNIEMKACGRKRKCWCEEENMWFEMMYPHFPNSILTERFGTSTRALDTRASKLGIKKTRKAKHEGISEGVRAGHEKRGITRELYGGYNKIYFPGHPRADNSGLIYEHVLVMEKIIGRYLNKDEHVIHIDKDKKNNNPDNLILRNVSEPGHGHIDEQELVMKRKHGVEIDFLVEHYNISRRTIYRILKQNGCIEKRKKKED